MERAGSGASGQCGVPEIPRVDAMSEVRWFAACFMTGVFIECEDRDHTTAVIRFHDEGKWYGYAIYKVKGRWCYYDVTEGNGRRWSSERESGWFLNEDTIKRHGLKLGEESK
jgi:hypothetical protein